MLVEIHRVVRWSKRRRFLVFHLRRTTLSDNSCRLSATSQVVQAAGRQVLGSSPYPFPDTTDFSSLLLQAQASGSKVLGLGNAGADTQNSIKQAHEFGINGRMRSPPC